MDEIPFKIHAVVDHGGWGEVLNGEGEFLFEVDSAGILQLQDAYPNITVVSATPAELASAASMVRMKTGTNFVNEGRVVGVNTHGTQGIEEANNWNDFEVFGVAADSGTGEIRVVTQNGASVTVDLESGEAHAATFGTPVYLGNTDGKVTTNPPSNPGDRIRKIGIVNGFPEYGTAVGGGDRVGIFLLLETRPIVTVS